MRDLLSFFLSISAFIALLCQSSLSLSGESELASDYKRCKKMSGVVGAEDIESVPGQQQIVLSHQDRRNELALGGLSLYDLKKKKLKLLNTSEIEDFHPHGISVQHFDSKNQIYVINHRSNGTHSVEKFELKNERLIWLKTITSKLFKSPNDLVAVGEESFYLTNDGQDNLALDEALEDDLLKNRSNVVFYDGTKARKVAKKINFANGITKTENKLLVSASKSNGILSYTILPNGDLVDKRFHELGIGTDNLTLSPDGSVLVARHSCSTCFLMHLLNPMWKSPSEILRFHFFPQEKKFSLSSKIFYDDGFNFSAASVGLEAEGYLFVGAVFDPGFVVCRK